MPQFYLAGQWAQLDYSNRLITIDRDLAHHLRVRRIKADDIFTVFDGCGHTAKARLSQSHPELTHIEIDDIALDCHRELPYRINLIQGLAGGDKMDWIVEKAVEMGAASITPIECERSVVKLQHDAKRLTKRLHHWQAIAQAACEQCDRTVLPNVDSVQSPNEGFLKHAAPLKIILCPNASNLLAHTLHSHPVQDIAIAIGPEGGFTPEEEEMAKRVGFIPLSLGSRVLRTETAGIVAISAVESVWSLKA